MPKKSFFNPREQHTPILLYIPIAITALFTAIYAIPTIVMIFSASNSLAKVISIIIFVVLVCSIIFIIAFYFLAQRDFLQMTFCFSHPIPIVETQHDLMTSTFRKKLTTTYLLLGDSVTIKSLYLAVITLKNTGNKAIEANTFFQDGITIELGEEARILDVSAKSTGSTALEWTTMNNHQLRIKKFVSTPDTLDTLKIFLESDQCTFEILHQSKHGFKIKTIDDSNERNKKGIKYLDVASNLISVTLFFISSAFLLFLLFKFPQISNQAPLGLSLLLLLVVTSIVYLCLMASRIFHAIFLGKQPKGQ